MDDWELFAERLTLIILIAVSSTCYRIAEFFGAFGIKCEVKYRQLATS